jgi:hypothetical protein
LSAVPGIGPDDDRLDLREKFDEKVVQSAHRVGEKKDRREVESVDTGMGGADLSGDPPQDAPGGDTVRRLRCMF